MSATPPPRNDPAAIASLLTTPATWAVIGLADNPDRTAYRIAHFLQGRLGMRIIPVHPRAESVHGEPGYPSLAAIATGPVPVVDLFVNSGLVGSVVDEAIAQRERLGIEALWFQLGVIDEDAAQRAEDAGLTVVRDTCPKIEWPRLQPAN